MPDLAPELFAQRYLTEVASHRARLNTSVVLEMPAANAPIVDATDVTKRAFFSASGITTATDRTLTLPNATAYIQGAQFVYQTAAFTLPNNTSLNACFTAASDTFTATAATTYVVDAWISLTTGATSHTTAFGLLGAGTATLTSANLVAVVSSNATNGGIAASQQANLKVGTAVVLTAASTAVDTHILLRGSFQVNAAGTIIPSVQFSADPTGTCQTNIGSYFTVYPIGTNAVVSHGPWA